MSSTIVAYISLVLQILAAGIAISLFKRTKYNSSWILISTGFILMVVAQSADLFPRFYPSWQEESQIIQRWLDFVISVVLVVGVFYIRKIFRFMQRVDEIRKETEKKVLTAVINTEERERKRFAKELHDGLGPLLSVTKMLVSGFDSANPEQVNDKIKNNLKQAIDEAIYCVRDISSNISPHILNNFGLKDAIKSFITKIESAGTISIDFTTNLNSERFAYTEEVIMYRVICELLTNTLRHADADRITIDLKLQNGKLYMEYTDNGIGFDVEGIFTSKGLGINNMQYRLRSANGDIKIMSERGEGMSAEAFIKV
ncbi:MAG: histidine kinase [Culturomica sp.]|jgi:signal transduction histidine kinase|nr:histidine kinase [Culturomica sp.]